MSDNFIFDVALFIDEIRKRPAIWDTKTDFPRDLKKKAWNEINDMFGEENMSPADKRLLGCKLQQKWKNLRTCFGRELKRQRNSGSVATRKSEYIYYKKMLFLTNVMSERDITEPEYVYFHEDETSQSETTDNKNLAEQLQTQYDDKNQSHTNQSVKNSKKRKACESEELLSNEDEDEDRLFLLSMHETLKQVPIKKKMGVKIKMLSILHDTLS
ncbi:uncharacterized protein LOC123874981 [Maniola jurtina]|uniref:uncharacterized protein LOC123874981 n=1 Tax=Maniola jurtina TaxID=191418 RepID=UPI001E68E1E6|nr:uncharacterized protein LOC123874981 [Maniola jurtina]